MTTRLGLFATGLLALIALAFVALNGGLLGFGGAARGAPPTEASVSDFSQCANDSAPSVATDCPGDWINGILQSTNSHYGEDQSVPQRLVLDLPDGGATTGRTVEITYEARKGSIHAYDSLATWNLTQTTAARCQGLPLEDCIPGPADTQGIPDDPTAVASDVCSSSATTGHMIAAGPNRVMTMYGGDITDVSAPVHDNAASQT